MIETPLIAPSNSGSSPQAAPAGSKPKGTPLRFWILIAVNIACAVGLFTSATASAAGLWTIALMVALMLAGIAVGFALSIASILGLIYVSGTSAAISVLSTAPYTASSGWSMSVLPMFIWMGLLLTQSGLTQRLYQATHQWFGWLPGGLAIGTTAAGAGLASVSGSSIGMTYALGRAGIPEMLKVGYDRRVAVGAVLTGGLSGQLIPPSIMMVVYAGIVSVPVGPQLLAGVVPGIGLAVMFALIYFSMALIFPQMFGRGKNQQAAAALSVTWTERLKSLGGLWGLPLIMVVLFGGLFTGYFTPTEAGAAAAFASLLITLFYTRKNQPLRQIAASLTGAAKATASIFLLLIGAEMLTRVLAVTGIAGDITDYIAELGLSRFWFLMALVVLYIFMGMFFDTMSMMLLTIPLLLPVLETYDIGLMWFGVFIIILGEVGMITPPVGVLAYICYNLLKRREVNQGVKVSLTDVFTSILWFLPFAIVFIIIMIFWPELATWLPSISSAS
ncbi:TRAP transporter large permease [Glutamicibacter arilaitensis]|uniref:TRAP transporter large permease n=1 Tax=Glutamicibacter arilaitensis TaxID=256701 RepID=UPI00384DA8B4